MSISMKSALAILGFFTLFPLESQAEARQSSQLAERCAGIEKMLLAAQLNLPNMEQSEYEFLDKSLKAAYKRSCEGDLSLGARDGAGTAGGSYPEGDGQFRWDGNIPLPNGMMFNAASMLMALPSNNSAPILGPFANAHRRCASGCSYTSWGVWGDAKHQARRSCHNSGQAIDIHAITCGGRTYAAGSARFGQYVNCMSGSLGIIYGNAQHKDHAHFQLRNCEMCSGLGCGSGKVRNSGGDDGDDKPSNRWGGNRNAQGSANDGDDKPSNRWGGNRNAQGSANDDDDDEEEEEEEEDDEGEEEDDSQNDDDGDDDEDEED